VIASTSASALPLAALGLALAAAFVHASWNVALAGAPDPEATTAVALVVGLVVFAPFAIAFWDVHGSAWGYAVASGALELVYFALLAAAYRRRELSVVYPVARGLAPVLVLAFGVAFLGAATSGRQVAGVLLVGAGVLVVRGLRRDSVAAGILVGAVIAACIAGYTLIDKHGLEHASPVPYLQLVTLIMTPPYLASLAITRGTGPLRRAVGWRAGAAGVAIFGAYALVLTALQLAPAAPVAAVRETSVVIAVGLAWLVLHERVTAVRLAGAALVATGVVLLAL
jgi:drug/metabolite transporter (DMT)-like permease